MSTDSPQPFVLSADALLPMDPALPPLIRHGGIVITGQRITAVGPLAELRTHHGNLPTQHHRGVLLPGFVNAHTHLELSHLSAANLPATSFPDWVSALLAGQPPAERLESVIRQAVRKGAAESLRAGVTTVGDISRHCRITRHELARRTRIRVPRIVSFGEVLALGAMRHRLAEMLDAASAPIPGEHPSDAYYTPGISPHAPYTVEGTALRAIVRRAVVQRLPLCMHLAELPDEAAFLRNLSGPLALNLMHPFLDHHIPLYSGGPIRWAELYGLLVCDPRNPPPRDLPVLLAHVNYCDHAEMMQLAAARASVAYCPRTHAFFRHPPHPYRDMLECGINVCLATDSLASNPDLSVLKEAQFVYQGELARPGAIIDPHVLLEMITRRGAIALGLEKHIGTLSANKFADCIILPLEVDATATAPALCHRLLTESPAPTALWLAGAEFRP